MRTNWKQRYVELHGAIMRLLTYTSQFDELQIDEEGGPDAAVTNIINAVERMRERMPSVETGELPKVVED